MMIAVDLQTWRRLSLAYACFGVAHTSLKLLVSLFRARRIKKMLASVPQARYADGILGFLPELRKNLHRRHDFVAEATLGMPVSKMWRGPKWDPHVVQICVRDPAIIKHFLKDNDTNYTKPPDSRDFLFKTMRVWLGQGIFVARHGPDAEDGGRNWARQRKIAAGIFTKNNFNTNMAEIFSAKADRFCSLLRGPADRGEPVDMQARFFQFTMDSIMEIFFGEVADTLGGQESKYATAYDCAHRSFFNYCIRVAPLALLMKLLPWPFGGLGGLGSMALRTWNQHFRDFKHALQILDTESRRIVDGCYADPALADRKDLLALFIQAENPINGPQTMSAEWLRDVVANFVIAGRDTTACTLSWMFYILATHPDIQSKVQQELDDVGVSTNCLPSMASLSAKQLPYLNGVLYETLRLYPPVPIDGKEAVADDVFPDGTKVPRHAHVAFMVYAMGRDPAVYHDPDIVKPERWIPFKEPSPFEFPVFQAGPRICLGMNMAVFEAKVVAAKLLQNYSFEMAPGEASKITYLPTAMTMSICNSGDKKNFDSHNLWLIPQLRNRPAA